MTKKTILYPRLSPGGKIETAAGEITNREWAAAEVRRINKASPGRQAEIVESGGLLTVEAYEHWDVHHPVGGSDYR